MDGDAQMQQPDATTDSLTVGHDVIAIGRVNMDLFSREVGAPFEEIRSFDAMVGGSPSNIAIAGSRLGLRTAVFTAVGDDRVGRFVMKNFAREGVDTSYVAVKEGKLTSLALLGNQPPSDFPLSFYREDPADIHLTIDEAMALPIEGTRVLLISGDALARGSTVEAARYCAEEAQRVGVVTVMDLDLRLATWDHDAAYGLAIRSVLSSIDVLIGTEEELIAALLTDPDHVMAGNDASTEDRQRLEGALGGVLRRWDLEAIVVKRGAQGVTVVTEHQHLDVASFPVEVVNTVGAGDAFAAGLLRSRLRGMAWDDAARFAAACGALEVTRHGCSLVFPTEAEVDAFLVEHGVDPRSAVLADDQSF
jgi:5-dehydro-2-deoxygluconokinase